MKPIKGINRDVNFTDTPDGQYGYAKNAVYSEVTGSIVNEKGNTALSGIFTGSYAGYSPLGKIKIGNIIVLFAVSGSNCLIGTFEDGAFTQKVLRTDLGFNTSNPITGKGKVLGNGDVVVVFRDGLNTPRYINLDETNVNTIPLNKLEQFPELESVGISNTIQQSGGGLSTGAYYIAVQHLFNDGYVSNVSAFATPIYINEENINSVDLRDYDGSDADTPSGKSIEIALTNLDTTYDKYRIVVIEKIGGVLTSYYLPEIPISSSSATTVFNGNEISTVVDLNTILTDSIKYNDIFSYTSLNDRLYGARTIADFVDYQPLANLIEIEYTATLETFTNTDNTANEALSAKRQQTKGFQDGEAYAFYIVWELLNGSFSPAFHIPGRVASTISYPSSIANDETDTNSDVKADNSPTFDYLDDDIDVEADSKYYQTRDTAGTPSVLSGSGAFAVYKGTMGFWENENEIYPDNDSFDNSASFNISSTPVTLTDITGQNVRHHKFPSLHFLSDELYGPAGSQTYLGFGKSDMPRLGINVSNVILPDELQGKVKGYRIMYAKRTYENSLVVEQSKLQFAAFEEGTGADDTYITSNGANWSIDMNTLSDQPDKNTINKEFARFKGFNLLKDRPSISPSYIRQELQYELGDVQRRSVAGGKIFLQDSVTTTAPYEATVNNIVGLTAGRGNVIKRVSDYVYLPFGTVIERGNTAADPDLANTAGETTPHFKINTDNGELDQTILVVDTEGVLVAANNEEYYLSTLCFYRTNIYIPFTSQQLVYAGEANNVITAGTYDDYTVDDGDTFVASHSYVSYGPRSGLTSLGNGGTAFTGNIYIHNFPARSTGNPELRHHVPSDPITYYFPRTRYTTGGFDAFTRGADSNDIRYNDDYSSIRDIVKSFPYDSSSEIITEEPYKILKGIEPNRSSSIDTSWREFLPADFYQSVTDKGKITNIQGYGTDILFIHHENALFRTRDKFNFNAGGQNVTLGSGEIFELEPQEFQPSTEGFAGTQHKHSCLLTKLGYTFVDAKQGNWFLATPKGIVLLTNGLKIFFRDNLPNINNDNFYLRSGNTKGFDIAYDERLERLILCVKDINDVTNNSYTISYSPLTKSIVSFHDWLPDMIFGDRKELYSFKYNASNSLLYQHGNNVAGSFYGAIYSFFVDAIFNNLTSSSITSLGYKIPNKKDKLFQTIEFKVEIRDGDDVLRYDETLTHLTSYTDSHCSGINPIVLGDIDTRNIRNRKGTWLFNKFRDVLDRSGGNTYTQFLDTIFNDFSIIGGALDTGQSVFTKRRFVSPYMVVRFEYDNTIDRNVILIDVDCKAIISNF